MIEYISLTSALAVSIVLILFTYRVYRKKQYVYAGTGTLLSIFAMAVTSMIATVIIDESTIKRLTKEHTIATIEFKNIGKQRFRVSFIESHQLPVEYELYGDQWQIGARVMKWNGFAAKMGLKPMYQFERLSGRYESVTQEINEQRSVYALTEVEKGNSIWDYLIEYQEYIPWLDSQYGSATYMPMKDGAVYTIKLSQGGLLARPRNHVATQSIKQWL